MISEAGESFAEGVLEGGLVKVQSWEVGRFKVRKLEGSKLEGSKLGLDLEVPGSEVQTRGSRAEKSCFNREAPCSEVYLSSRQSEVPSSEVEVSCLQVKLPSSKARRWGSEPEVPCSEVYLFSPEAGVPSSEGEVLSSEVRLCRNHQFIKTCLRINFSLKRKILDRTQDDLSSGVNDAAVT